MRNFYARVPFFGDLFDDRDRAMPGVDGFFILFFLSADARLLCRAIPLEPVALLSRDMRFH